MQFPRIPRHLIPFNFRAHKKIRRGYIVGHLGGRSKIPLVVIAYQMPSTEYLHLYTCARNEEETSARQLTSKQLRSMILTEKWGAQHKSSLLIDAVRGAKNRVVTRRWAIKEHGEAVAKCAVMDHWYPHVVDHDCNEITNREQRRVDPITFKASFMFNKGPWEFVLQHQHDYKYRHCAGRGESKRWIRPMDYLLRAQATAIEELATVVILLAQSDKLIDEYDRENGGAS